MSLQVSWEQYHKLIERLALVVHESGYAFDQIICIARGGLRVGDVLSRIYERPLAILSTHSYAADGGTVRGDLVIAEHMTMTAPRLGGRVLLVDDMVDSGHTLAKVVAPPHASRATGSRARTRRCARCRHRGAGDRTATKARARSSARRCESR